MSERAKLDLFNKTDEVLVYLASTEYAKELLKSCYKPGDMVYIHVKRNTGFVIAYKNNDIDQVVTIDDDEWEYILEFCKDVR